MRVVPPLNDGPANSSRDLVAGLRAHIWTILLTAAVVTAIVVAMSLRQTPQYTAAASVVLQDSGDTTSTPNMATEKQIASSDTVANQVIGSLHLRETPDEVASGLSISVPVDTNVLVFSYTSPDPREAQQRAQAFADAYLSYRHQALLRASQAANDLVDVRIAELQNELKTVTNKMNSATSHVKIEAYRVEANSIVAQIGVQEQRASAQVGSLQATGDRLVTASLPTRPSQPRVIVNGLLGVFFGLSLGIVISLWRASFARRVESGDDVEQTLNIPLLAVIPRSERVATSSTVTIGERTPATEAYRELVARVLSTPMVSSNGNHPPGLALQPVGGTTRKLAVVALDEELNPGEVAANMGAVMALSGRSVLVVSTTTDENGWDGVFGPHSGPGITDVMRGHADLSEAIRPTAIDGLRALPRGAEDQSWMLLDADRLRGTLSDMSSFANVVIVQVAGHVGAGTAAVVASCDEVIYTGALRSTTVTEARRIQSELAGLGKPTIGAVMVDRQRSRGEHKAGKWTRSWRPRGRRADATPAAPPSAGDPPAWKAVRHIVRSRLSEHPRLYLPLARLRYREPSPEVIGRETELVIDGYTRSACTFAVYAFQLSQQNARRTSRRSPHARRGGPPSHQVRLAHHLHAPAQLLEAARRGIPALVVIREPEGAILSQVLREPHVSVRGALVSYTRFYSRLIPHASSFVAGEFNDVTNDFGSVIRRLNKRFGTHYRTFDSTEESLQECFDLIKERTTTDPTWRNIVLGFESGTVSLDQLQEARPARRSEGSAAEVWIPSEERTKAKEALREQWNAPELSSLRDRAIATYREFLRATDNDETAS
jgi:capsular polysaccharide biosynthesis protein/Mrp family chromosome partitioning ATPase